jgi:integrase
MWRIKLYRGAWYAVTRHDGKTKRVALRTSDREIAQQRFLKFLSDQESAPETISEILDAYRRDKNLKSAKTADFCVRTLKPFWGHLRPNQVTRELCRNYTRKRNRKNSTTRRELEVLRAALHWNDAHTRAVIELPPPAPPRDRTISRAELNQLILATNTPHIRLFIILAWSTAARSNAILDLTWDRVDFERGTINLMNGDETNKRRSLVPMTDTVRRALEVAYKARTSDYVIEFAGDKVQSILKAFKRTAHKAGLSGVTPHVMRHSAAVRMAEAGVPMSEISQYMGHTSTRVTERVYARYSPEYLKRAAGALE